MAVSVLVLSDHFVPRAASRAGLICLRCLHMSRRQMAERSPRRERGSRVSGAIEAIGQGAREREHRGKDRKDKRSPPRPSSARDSNPFKAASIRPVTFEQPTRESLLQQGYGTATIADSRFDNVLRDRMRLVSQPGIDTSTYQHWPAAAASENRPASRMSDAGVKMLGDNFIAGKHDEKGLLGNKEQQSKEPAGPMETVQRVLHLNSTYHAEDADRFAAKLKSLMPVTTRARPQQNAQKQ